MKKYAEITMIIFSLILLQISNLFQWDSNPVMGLDKIFADILIILLCCLMIKKMGIWSGYEKNKYNVSVTFVRKR